MGGRRCLASINYELPSPFHGDAKDERDSSGIRTLSDKGSVSFLCLAVGRGSISPTFSTFSEAVHAGL